MHRNHDNRRSGRAGVGLAQRGRGPGVDEGSNLTPYSGTSFDTHTFFTCTSSALPVLLVDSEAE
jgi:hypothetical protein